MKRFPAYDPPEYVDWVPDADLLTEYRSTLDRDPDRRRVIDALSDEQLLQIYRRLVRARLHDVTLMRWVRLGTIWRAPIRPPAAEIFTPGRSPTTSCSRSPRSG